MATLVENLADGATKKDKMRLAKERKEEKSRSQAVQERALWEKEHRSQQQYERSVVERGRRMEEQKQKDLLRRLAVEEKRRQQVEEEKERLEALMRRSTERNLQAEQRPKRWTWGGAAGVCEASPTTDPKAASKAKHVPDFMILPESSESPLIRHTSMREKASPSPHRSPYRASPSKADRKRVSASFCEDFRTPRSPQTEKAEISSCQTPTDSSMKKLDSPATPIRSSSTHKTPSTPKRSKSCRSRIQSPASPGQFPSSPLRHRSITPSFENKKWDGEEKGSLESKSTLERKTSRAERIPKSSSKEFRHHAESPVTPTGKAGTTDAEEASRLLTERRRLAREQKEREEKLRLEEEEKKAEELQRQQHEEERHRHEQAAQHAEDKHSQREHEGRTPKELRWKELQEDLERQREEAVLRVHREADRKRRERELLKIQEEEERQQRKKRIEEIMKRTRKPDESKKEEGAMETAVLSSPSKSEVTDSPANTESPVICPESLEAKSIGMDDLSDGVQSMDVSPVSRDDIPVYSPVSMNSVALGEILALTRQVSRPEVAAPAFGDCNKNLLRDCGSTAIDSALFKSLRPTSDKLNT